MNKKARASGLFALKCAAKLSSEDEIEGK